MTIDFCRRYLVHWFVFTLSTKVKVTSHSYRMKTSLLRLWIHVMSWRIEVVGATSSDPLSALIDWSIKLVRKWCAVLQSEERSDEGSERRSSSSDAQRPSRVSVIISHDK